MTYSLRGMGTDISSVPLPVRVTTIRVRAAVLQSMASAMSDIARRYNAASQVSPFNTLMGNVRALAVNAAASTTPAVVAKGAIYYGIMQMTNLGAAATQAADKVLANPQDPQSAIDGARSREILRLAEQALDTGENIMSALLRVFSVIAPSRGVSGLGATEAEQILATLALGVLFTASLGTIAIPIALVVALCNYCDMGDTIIAALKDIAKVVVKPLAEAAGDWLRFVLIGGTVLLSGYAAWKIYEFKKMGPMALMAPNARARRLR